MTSEKNRLYREATSKLDAIDVRLSKARKKFVNEEIDAEDFKMIKMECGQERTSLESEFISLNFVSEPIEKLLNQVFANMRSWISYTIKAQ
ncbi:MAG TPA: hypothetical protein VIH86_12210 [Puia sp.]